MSSMSKFMKKYTKFIIKDLNYLDSNRKYVIIFWHPKCSSCQKIMFSFPKIYLRLKIKWIFIRFCNVLENSNLCMKIWIYDVPCLLLIENGKIIKKVTGERDILEFLYKI